MRSSCPIASARSVTSAPVASHSSAMALMKEIFVARKALAATFTSWAVAKSVTTTGVSAASTGANAARSSCSARSERTPNTSRSGWSVSSTAKPSRRNSGFQASSTSPPRAASSCAASRSAVPAGTAERLADQVAAARGDELELAWNPEFLREGFAVEDTLTPDRLVFGVRSERAELQLREAFAPVVDLPTPVVVTDFATAQLVKVAANAFLATKISFINAMAEVCEATGGDVTLLSKALSYDTRIGGRFLNAGLGFGGGCLPKDIRAFMARAGELGVDQALSFLKEVDAINLRRRARMVDLARELVGGSFGGMRVAVLGAAFKPNSDDIRDSPALDVATSIQQQGAAVCLYDPQAMDNARVKHPELGYRDSAVEAARGADIVLHLTEWAEFRSMDPAVLGEVVADRRIVDGRNALDPAAWRAAGWTYRALGRP